MLILKNLNKKNRIPSYHCSLLWEYLLFKTSAAHGSLLSSKRRKKWKVVPVHFLCILWENLTSNISNTKPFSWVTVPQTQHRLSLCPLSSSVICPRPPGGILVLRPPQCFLASRSGQNRAIQGSADGSEWGSAEERHSTKHHDLHSAGWPAARDPVHNHHGNRGCRPAELRLQTGCHR